MSKEDREKQETGKGSYMTHETVFGFAGDDDGPEAPEAE